MKTHPPRPGSHPQSRSTSLATLLVVAAIHSQAACGPGPATITNAPSLGGSAYTITALNATGQITGYSLLAGDQVEHAFLLGPSGLLDLGTLGGDGSYSYCLNDSGQVGGESATGSVAETHGFFFNGSSMLNLGTLGGPYSSVAGMNNAGQLTGLSLTSSGSIEAFLYSGGTMIGLGHLGGGFSQAAAINESGHIVGNSYNDLFEQHAFLYQNGAMLDLGTLGGSSSDAYAINNQDVVVGQSTLASGETHGFIYSNSVMTDLGTLGGSYSTAYRINNAGQVIGRSFTAGDAQLNGFFYSAGVMIDMGTLGGLSSTPYALNNLGQVVGQSEQADGAARAFLWQNGSLIDLNSLLPTNSGWQLDNARFINDAGRVVGTGVFNSQPQWYILDLGKANQAPVANAGTNQIADCSSIVTLDGTSSSDPDGDALTYEWSENGTVLGSTATLTTAFTAGIHTVTLRVSDACGDSALDTVVVTAGDTTPPTVSCPGSLTATSNTVPHLLPLVIASDNCTAANALIITQAPAAGSTASSSPYVVTVTVTDAAGNAATATTTVTVTTSGDTTPPVIKYSPKHLVLPANSEGKTKVPDLTRFVIARDDTTPAKSLRISQTPAADTLLELGTHIITVTVADGAGNTASRKVKLQVIDCTAPKIHSATATPNVLNPANGKMVQVEVRVTATDNCDAKPDCKIVYVRCDEPTSRNDIKITGALSVQLAATKNAHGNGRIYTLIVSAKDDSGNTTYKQVTVSVPRR